MVDRVSGWQACVIFVTPIMLLAPTSDLNLIADYRRLGVGMDECRLFVIRDAATRRCSPFAANALSELSLGADQQLCTVAMSAYRLLDPRRREDAIQRAHIGRVVPLESSFDGEEVYPEASIDESQEQASVSLRWDWDQVPGYVGQHESSQPQDSAALRIVPELARWTASLQSLDLLDRSDEHCGLVVWPMLKQWYAVIAVAMVLFIALAMWWLS